MKTVRHLLTTIGALLFQFPAFAVPGDLDLSFGGTGKVTTAIGNSGELCGGNSVKIQNDGKIVVAGYSGNNIALVRYNPNGSLDATFGGTGTITTPFGNKVAANSVAIQTDDKIVVAGQIFRTFIGDYDQFAIVRYNADGRLDTSFGGGTGKVSTEIGGANSVVVQADGKIMVAGGNGAGGHGWIVLARYNSDGSPDQHLGNLINAESQIRTGNTSYFPAPASIGASGMVVQGDGRIIVAGGYTANQFTNSQFAVVRFTSIGDLDTSVGRQADCIL